jgi:hypothetical protein
MMGEVFHFSLLFERCALVRSCHVIVPQRQNLKRFNCFLGNKNEGPILDQLFGNILGTSQAWNFFWEYPEYKFPA